MDTFIFVVNIIGTLAFAASGAMIGLNKNMDIFGVCILGLTPPMAFRDPTYAVLALATSAVFFSLHVRQVLMHNQRRYDLLLFWMDALGLGAFTVIGVELAFQQAAEPTFFLLVFVGVLTGVGGGVLRDLLAQQLPYIFVKHVYACASLAGALLCAGLWDLDRMAAMLVGMSAVVLIRVLAAHYHWNLPKAKI